MHMNLSEGGWLRMLQLSRVCVGPSLVSGGRCWGPRRVDVYLLLNPRGQLVVNCFRYMIVAPSRQEVAKSKFQITNKCFYGH